MRGLDGPMERGPTIMDIGGGEEVIGIATTGMDAIGSIDGIAAGVIIAGTTTEGTIVARFFLALLFFIPIAGFALGCSPLAAESICQAHKWAVLLRAGPSFIASPFGGVNAVDQNGVQAHRHMKRHTGTLYNVRVGYGISRYFVVGIEGNYDSHFIKKTRVRFSEQNKMAISGDTETVTGMLVAEFHPLAVMRLSPYLMVGAGANFNWVVNKNADLSSFSTKASLALKGGVGFDYFLAPFVALNGELGYLYNRAPFYVAGTTDASLSASGNGYFNISNVSFLMGLRFLF